MNNLILQTPFRVSTAETDMFARIRTGALVNLLIQAAIQSADQLGFGFEDFSRKKLFWVVSRFTIEIYRPLIWNEAGTVETWPKNLDKLLYLRDFLLKDEKQQIVAKSTSGWLAVDAIAKVPKVIDDVDDTLFTRMKDIHGIEAHPEKLPPVHGEEVAVNKVTYFDLDVNRHVTTTRYFDWLMDTFPPEFHNRHYPIKLSVNFMKEIKAGDIIHIIRQECTDNTYLFEGINRQKETTAFRAKVGF